MMNLSVDLGKLDRTLGSTTTRSAKFRQECEAYEKSRQLIEEAAKKLYNFLNSEEGTKLRNFLFETEQTIEIGQDYEHVYFLSNSIRRKPRRLNRTSTRYYHTIEHIKDVLSRTICPWDMQPAEVETRLAEMFDRFQKQITTCTEKV